MSELPTDDDSVEEQHALTVIALLQDLEAEPFDVDDVPKDEAARPDFYNEVVVSRKYSDGDYFLSGEQNLVAYRLTTRAVARRLTNARMMRGLAGRLEGRTITVGGIESTPIEFVAEQGLGDDDGWFSGRTEWSYQL